MPLALPVVVLAIIKRSDVRREICVVSDQLEHSVLEKSPDGGFTEGAPVLEPLEHSVL